MIEVRLLCIQRVSDSILNPRTGMHVKGADENAIQALQLGPNATLHKTVSLHRLRQGICEGEAPEPPVIIFIE